MTLVRPQKNDLNDNISEVNNLRVNICGKRHIPIIRYSKTICPYSPFK